jgi:hypothetical protein
MNVITFTLNTATTYYVQEVVTLELLEKFINKVCPDLSVCIRRDHDEEWLEMEGTILATQYDGCDLYSNNEDMLNWKSIEEITL